MTGDTELGGTNTVLEEKRIMNFVPTLCDLINLSEERKRLSISAKFTIAQLFPRMLLIARGIQLFGAFLLICLSLLLDFPSDVLSLKTHFK